MKRLLFLLTFLPSLAFAQNYPHTQFISTSPTVDTGAYATGDLIGGKLTFTGALRNTTNAGYITSVLITDLAAQSADLELVLFSTNPTGTTFTDQAAFDVADADVTKIVAVIALGSTSRFNFNDNGVKYLGSLAIPLGVTPANTAGTIIYGALVSRGTPTFAASTDVSVVLGISQD